MSTVPANNVNTTSIVSVFSPSKAAPHSMSQLYLGGSFVTGGVFPNGPPPSSGPIRFGQFAGASAVVERIFPPVNFNTNVNATQTSTGVYTITTTASGQSYGNGTYTSKAVVPSPDVYLNGFLSQWGHFLFNNNPSAGTPITWSGRYDSFTGGHQHFSNPGSSPIIYLTFPSPIRLSKIYIRPFGTAGSAGRGRGYRLYYRTNGSNFIIDWASYDVSGTDLTAVINNATATSGGIANCIEVGFFCYLSNITSPSFWDASGYFSGGYTQNIHVYGYI
jgi:hypothetical protein